MFYRRDIVFSRAAVRHHTAIEFAPCIRQSSARCLRGDLFVDHEFVDRIQYTYSASSYYQNENCLLVLFRGRGSVFVVRGSGFKTIDLETAGDHGEPF